MKPEIALAKIKILIKRYYEDFGRYSEFNMGNSRDLISEIDGILDEVKIPKKLLIAESL